jgi:hypothetical protein
MQLSSTVKPLPDFYPIKTPFFLNKKKEINFWILQIICWLSFLLSLFLIKNSIHWIVLGITASFFSGLFYFFDRMWHEENRLKVTWNTWHQKAMDMGWNADVLKFTLKEYLPMFHGNASTDFEKSYYLMNEPEKYRQTIFQTLLFKCSLQIFGCMLLSAIILNLFDDYVWKH